MLGLFVDVFERFDVCWFVFIGVCLVVLCGRVGDVVC